MKALIVAAGRGNRLSPTTDSIPKAAIEINGESLINRSVRILKSHGIDDITVVVGYRHEKIRELLGNSVNYVMNPDFATTNNMVSMELGMTEIGNNPFIYLHGDIWYEPSIISLALIDKNTFTLIVDKKHCGEEEMKVRIEDGFVIEADKGIPTQQTYGEWLGIATFNSSGAEIYHKIIQKLLILDSQQYDCAAISHLAMTGLSIDYIAIGNRKWIEIDFIEDLIEARKIAYDFK